MRGPGRGGRLMALSTFSGHDRCTSPERGREVVSPGRPSKLTEEIRRRDSALERQQELTAMFANRLRELEAPQASQESPPDTTTPQSATEDPHSEAEPIQRRSWWRRMFGG